MISDVGFRLSNTNLAYGYGRRFRALGKRYWQVSLDGEALLGYMHNLAFLVLV